METQDLLDLAQKSMQAFNARDWDRFAQLHARDAVYDEVGSGRKVTGRNDIIQAVRGWTEAFSDMKGTITQRVASDDLVACAVTFEGTQDGELVTPAGPVHPSNKHVTTRCLQLLRVADGHIVETRNYFDMLSVLEALEATPTAAHH